MFLNIQIDLIILKTHDQQFTLTTKKSLYIIFNPLPTGPVCRMCLKCIHYLHDTFKMLLLYYRAKKNVLI